MVASPRMPLSGLLDFKASGNGTFDAPRNDVQIGIDEYFVADEGIGQVTAQLGVRGETLTESSSKRHRRVSQSPAPATSA